MYSSQTQNQGVFGYINSYGYDCESITWTTDGANAGSVFYHSREKFNITNVCGLLRPASNEVDLRYLFHQLRVLAPKAVNKGMGNPKLMANSMKLISVPIPSLPEQKRIAGILDQMDTLVNDLTSGLPAELEARRKQYAYYRDRLLTFKEKTQM